MLESACPFSTGAFFAGASFGDASDRPATAASTIRPATVVCDMPVATKAIPCI